MKYITTTEAAEKWQLSTRRIAKLAVDGRIPGTIRIGNRWMIPENAEKPLDSRRKPDASTKYSPSYHFPAMLFGIYSTEQLETEYSLDEKLLYEGAKLYESGEVDECVRLFEKLLITTENEYVRIGTYYWLFFAYHYLGRFKDAVTSADNLNLCIDKSVDHKEELSLLSKELNALMNGISAYAAEASSSLNASYSRECLVYLTVLNSFSQVKSLDYVSSEIIRLNEVSCSLLEDMGYSYSAMYMHTHLSMMNIIAGNEKMEHYHLKSAVDIAIEHDFYSTLAFYLCYFPDSFRFLEANYPKEAVDKIFRIGETMVTRQAELMVYLGGTSVLSKLTQDDYKYISYAVKGYTIENIAKIENSTIYNVKKSYASIYSKTGTLNKKDLIDTLKNLMFSPGAK